MEASKGPAGIESSRRAELVEWIDKVYRDTLGLEALEGGTRFKRFVRGLHAAGPPEVLLSGKRRCTTFLRLKTAYSLGPSGQDCRVLTATVGEKTTNYGYLYYSGDGTPEYLCVSPTYASKDGEYRKRFVRHRLYEELRATWAAELSPFEEVVAGMVRDGKLKLGEVWFPGKGRDVDDRARTEVLSVALILDLWEYARGISQAHTSAAYIALLGAVAQEAPALVELSRERISGGWLAVRRMVHAGPAGESAIVRCGQKLTPMRLREAMEPLDCNYPVWREVLAAGLAADLVVNFVTPSFPLHVQWVNIEGAVPALFENEAMKDRYHKSEVAEAAVAAIREARRGMVAAASEAPQLAEMRARLLADVEFAQKRLLAAPVAMVNLMEDVGWTLGSMGIYARRALVQTSSVTEAFSSPDAAARHLFELAYAAHCLHARQRLVHGDIHSNNVTFYRWGHSLDVPALDDPIVAFVAGERGEADTFVFPATGASCCIIDFSRCLFGPELAPRLAERKPAQFAANFYRDQAERVLKALRRCVPEYVDSNRDSLRAAILTNFEAVFPVLCAVDMASIGASVGEILAREAEAKDELALREFRIAPEAIEIAGRLESEARDFLVAGLHDLLENPGHRRKAPKFPGDVVLRSVFGRWLYSEQDPARLRTAQLVDFYNYNAPLGHSSTDYSRFPPWGRIDEIEKRVGAQKMGAVFEFGLDAFFDAIRPNPRAALISERLRAAQEKLDGPPEGRSSSPDE